MIWNDEALRAELIALQKAFDAFKDQVFALGKVSEETSHHQGTLREEFRLRQQALSNEMTEMESRIMTRIEELEDAKAGSPESDILDTEAETLKRGYVPWSQRKKATATGAADPNRWKAPAPAPKE